MKRKLLILFCSIFISFVGIAQTITANQIDNFEDATEQGWKHASVNTDSPVNIATDGPTGVDDNYLKTSNNGVNQTPGARHIFFNTDSRWKGNYTTAGIVAIRMHIRNSGVNPLHLRVALRGGDNVSWMSSSTPVIIPIGNVWSLIEIPVLAGNFTVTSGTDLASNVLTNVIEIRILSNDGNDVTLQAALHKGDLRVQISHFDNIKASSTFLSTPKNQIDNSFSISPNPGRDRLNLKLSKTSNNTVEVFDVLGKKIFADRVTNITKSIDVSQWNSGLYLVRLTSDTGTQTKRFVKQ